MRKLSLLLALCAITNINFAQEVEKPTSAPTYRALSFYLDTFTGHLTDGTDGANRTFVGNEFEFGMTYSQNFGTVPWLSMWVKTLVVTGVGVNPATGTGFAGGAFDQNDSFIGTGRYGIQLFGLPRVQLGLNFNNWAILAIDTRGLLATESYYTVRFGGTQAFTLQGILEMWMVPTTLGVAPGLGLGPESTYTVVDLFEIRFNYEIGFAPGWTYRSKFGLRWGSGGDTDGLGDPIDISATAFGESLHLRWENQVVWVVSGSFYMWTQLRYNVNNVANARDVDHQLFIQAGLGYSFNFTDN